MKSEKDYILKGLLFMWLLSLSELSHAMLPVVDPASIAKTFEVIQRLQKNFELMKNQYGTIKHQYSQMKEQYKSITGNYGWGHWKNTIDDLKQDKEWAAEDWDSALKGMSGGNPDRYRELVDEYRINHPDVPVKIFEKGSDIPLARSYDNNRKTNQASAVSATYEFNDINMHLQTLYQLGQKIEDAKMNHDMKSSMDLNSRIELEIGYIAIEELRMQSVLNQQISAMESQKLTQEQEVSVFNQAGESNEE